MSENNSSKKLTLDDFINDPELAIVEQKAAEACLEIFLDQQLAKLGLCEATCKMLGKEKTNE